MSSYTPQTDLWLERSRLIGMVLAGMAYGALAVDAHNSRVDSRTTIGAFLVLTVQSLIALTRRPRHGGKIADHRLALISYILITFVLVTISTAGNAKYTEMIWIDLRDAPGGPLKLVKTAWSYRVNIMALCW